jgi:sugar O-acyltransferase (sialic acid O-acetyltransferase NeuD family)
MILFGVRSPIVVEYETTCARLGITVSVAVSVSGIPRILDVMRVVELDAFRSSPTGDSFIACAFSPVRRVELAELAASLSLHMAPALVDPHAVLAPSVRTGVGTFINAGAVIGAVTAIGRNVLINRSVSIGHHCVIGDNVSIGPGVTAAGNIQIGAGSIIGAGATILPGIRIGRNAVVSAGALVRRNVADGVFVDGQPAIERPFKLARSSLMRGEE